MTKSSGPMAPPAISNLVTTLCSITWFSSACIIEPSWFFSVCIIEPSCFIVRSHQQRNLPQAYTHSQLFSHVYSPVPDRPRAVYRRVERCYTRGMKAYSQDLRQRVLRAVDAGQRQAEIAKTFTVSVATIKRY